MKKKYFLTTVILFITIIFNISNSFIYAQTKPKKTPVPLASTNADIEKGKILVSKSDCFACHKQDVKLIGPSYKMVAQKYAATDVNFNLLSQKIIKGGAGVWGTMPMSPHPTLKAEDVKLMIKYILSVK